MDTEPRPSAPESGDLVEDALDRDIPTAHGRSQLWTEDPVGTPRMPDPVRNAAVRAVLIASFTLIEATVAMLAAAGDSWLTAPAMLCTVISTVVATWAVLDVWITRQVWNQRNGVVSSPSSAARALRRERRRAHRKARQERGTGRAARPIPVARRVA
jgi:transposase